MLMCTVWNLSMGTLIDVTSECVCLDFRILTIITLFNKLLYTFVVRPEITSLVVFFTPGCESFCKDEITLSLSEECTYGLGKIC